MTQININFDLSVDPATQLANFRTIKKELESMGINFSNPKVSSNASVKEYSIGENEKAWLSFSGKSRMNMRDKTISREAQAALYLSEKGMDIPNKDFNTEPHDTPEIPSQDDNDGDEISDRELFEGGLGGL